MVDWLIFAALVLILIVAICILIECMSLHHNFKLMLLHQRKPEPDDAWVHEWNEYIDARRRAGDKSV